MVLWISFLTRLVAATHFLKRTVCYRDKDIRPSIFRLKSKLFALSTNLHLEFRRLGSTLILIFRLIIPHCSAPGIYRHIYMYMYIYSIIPTILRISVVDPKWFFYPDPDPTFQLVSDPDPFSDPTYSCSIFDINFILLFLPCKWVRVLIMTRYKLFRGIFFYTKGVLCLNRAFLWRNCQIFYMITRKFYFKFISDPLLLGSGMIFPDPAKSFGSDRIRIHNTATYM